MITSEYLEQERKSYALYVLKNRALPSICDGLKAAGRRVLWTARDGKKYKTATLAGFTMPIHPHAAPDGVINTLTGQYLNNIPLFKGSGAFGTRLNPTAAASSRYTSVQLSQFTKDVIFKDSELIEMIDNYDQTLKEPKNFLPLIPIVLLNPIEGIGLGFACDILPRSLESIIKSQIQSLSNKKITEGFPSFKPFKSESKNKILENDKIRWMFESNFERLNSFELKITELPYGKSYDRFITTLNKLEESGYLKDYTDSSTNNINIILKFPRGYLANTDDEIIKKKIGLISIVSENLNVLDFNGEKVINPPYETIIKDFTSYRLTFYKTRYERLLGLLEKDIQKYKDIILAIDKKIGNVSVKIKDRDQLKEYLEKIGIVNLDYISDLPIYRFTVKEREKIELKLKDALMLEQDYHDILDDDQKRIDIYINELKEVLKNYKGKKYE